ncbi:MAG: TRL-like family protein [Treponema sp.]|nr:TRL-like family protein [Treponema sp.]
MMKRVFLVLAAAGLLASCVTSTPDFYSPIAVTNNPIGTKVGEAKTSEGGILQAAQNGGITKIATVDVRYSKDGTTVIVSGE